MRVNPVLLHGLGCDAAVWQHRFAPAGFSMGGYVALEMLRQAPKRVQRLTLLDTSARRDPPEEAAWRQAAVAVCARGEYAKVIDDMTAVLLRPELP